MAILSEKERTAICSAIARLMMLSRHSLSPTQERIATESARELMWVLGLPEHTYERKLFVMKEPDGATIDGASTPLLEGPRS